MATRRAAAGTAAAERARWSASRFSGGGIRSAAFNLGVLQALEPGGLLRAVDYLSTVSGGGYIALVPHVAARARAREARHGPWEKHPSRTEPARCSTGCAPMAAISSPAADCRAGHSPPASSRARCSICSYCCRCCCCSIGLASGDWFEFRWPPELKMPGAGAVPAHDGFMLLAIAGIALLALYLLATLAFALSTVLPPLRQLSAGQYPAATARAAARRWAYVYRHRIAAGPCRYRGNGGAVPARRLRSRNSRAISTWIVPLVTGFFSVRQANKQGEHAGTFAVAGSRWCCAGCSRRSITWRITRDLLATPAFMAWLARRCCSRSCATSTPSRCTAITAAGSPRHSCPKWASTPRRRPSTRCCSGSRT